MQPLHFDSTIQLLLLLPDDFTLFILCTLYIWIIVYLYHDCLQFISVTYLHYTVNSHILSTCINKLCVCFDKTIIIGCSFKNKKNKKSTSYFTFLAIIKV